MTTAKGAFLATARIVLGFMLAFAGIVKGLDHTEAIAFIQSLGFTGAVVEPVLSAMIVIEISVGLPYALGIELRLVSKAVATIFLLFTLVSLYAWQSSPGVPCGCFSGYLQVETDIWMVLRNAVSTALSSWIAFQKEHIWSLQDWLNRRQSRGEQNVQ